MGLLSSIFRLFKAILKKIFNGLKQFLKKFWLVILIIVLIYFAPVIIGYLTSVGAPQFLISGMTWLSGATPFVTSVVGAIGSGMSYVGSTAWNAYASASLGTQLSLAVGASMLLAPDETTAVISETVDVVADVGSKVIGGVARGLGSTWLWVAAGVGGLFLLGRRRKAGAA